MYVALYMYYSWETTKIICVIKYNFKNISIKKKENLLRLIFRYPKKGFILDNFLQYELWFFVSYTDNLFKLNVNSN